MREGQGPLSFIPLALGNGLHAGVEFHQQSAGLSCTKLSPGSIPSTTET